LQDRQVPLQALLQHTPSTQKPEAHALALLHAWPLLVLQFPLASQACPLEQLPGTSVPAWARTQVPSWPLTLHDLHGPVQDADSQHTPSTQLPDAQVEAVLEEHPSPLPRPVTLYSQVSSSGVPLALPPKRTTTPRALSNAMAMP
jgi:hypothetical protein